MILMIVAAASQAPQCGQEPLPAAIEAYGKLIQRQDSAAIAHLFGSDGVVDNPGAAPIRGEAASGKFLGSFKGAVVKSEALDVAGMKGAGADWLVTGRFHQTGLTPEGKDYDVAGSFDSTWSCSADGWRIRRMSTGK